MSDWDSELYSKNSSLQYKGATDFIYEHINKFKGKALNILDIGCGDGKITKEIGLILNESTVRGIDRSTSMVEYASKNHSNGEKLRFTVGDASELDFQQEFDLIFSFYCLQWVADKTKLFKEISNALKPNGIALLLMPVIYPHYFKIREKMLLEPKWQYHSSNYEHSSHGKFADSNYIQYAINAGLNIIKAEIIPEQFTFRSKEEFCNFLEPLLPHFLHSDKNAKRSFISELVEQYKVYDQSENWIYKYYIYRLLLKKEK
jgi:ubiquinone/menaquinone biosynthesis C-methylase UbiE